MKIQSKSVSSNNWFRMKKHNKCTYAHKLSLFVSIKQNSEIPLIMAANQLLDRLSANCFQNFISLNKCRFTYGNVSSGTNAVFTCKMKIKIKSLI